MVNKMRDPGPVMIKPGISEHLKMILWWLSIGTFSGFVLGFLTGVIVAGWYR